jgi:hypothetical protein
MKMLMNVDLITPVSDVGLESPHSFNNNDGENPGFAWLTDSSLESQLDASGGGVYGGCCAIGNPEKSE